MQQNPIRQLPEQLASTPLQKMGAMNITGTNIVERTTVRAIFWVLLSLLLPDFPLVQVVVR